MSPSPGRRHRARRVVIVEDDPAWVMLAREAFRDAAPDVELELLADGDEALAWVAGGMHADLVILDLNLPGTDGREVLAALQVAAVPTPVVVLTASSSPHDRRLVTELGVADLQTKPTSYFQLVALIGRLMEGIPSASGRGPQPPE